jgi:hypothetical protein
LSVPSLSWHIIASCHRNPHRDSAVFFPQGAEASGATPLELSHSFDENPSPIVWTDAGIYFSGSEKTASHLFCCGPVDPTASSFSGSITRVTGPDDGMFRSEKTNEILERFSGFCLDFSLAEISYES